MRFDELYALSFILRIKVIYIGASTLLLFFVVVVIVVVDFLFSEMNVVHCAIHCVDRRQN